MNIDPAHATAYIINPLTGKKANFANLFSSHPPTAERVARLRHQHVAHELARRPASAAVSRGSS